MSLKNPNDYPEDNIQRIKTENIKLIREHKNKMLKCGGLIKTPHGYVKTGSYREILWEHREMDH